MAGAGSADAVTNANAAVLAHSEVLIPNLNSTHFALAARHRRGPAEGPSGREAAAWIFGECGADATEFHFVVCHSALAIAAGLRLVMDVGMTFGAQAGALACTCPHPGVTMRAAP